MIINLIMGRLFTENNTLNSLIVIIEIAAAMGFFGSPGLIYRFSIRQTGLSPKSASRFNLICTAVFLVAAAAAVCIFRLSILIIPGILIWSFFNYRILVHGYRYPDGKMVDSGFPASLFDRYQEIVIYIIVGVFATVVSWGVFYLVSLFLDSSKPVNLIINTLLNWTAGVLVAYPMNRSWVFKSKSPEKMKEFLGFVASRITTLVIEELLMPLLVNIIGINQYVSKYVIASIVVIVLNYVFSKLFVFKKK